jgi:hypothetical protein
MPHRTALNHPRGTSVTRQKAQARWLIFINMPQSKTALLEAPSIEPLATVPTQGGGGYPTAC